MLIALFSVPILSTLLGGMLAIRFRRHILVLIAVGAGLLLGAAFLDLLPEAIVIGNKAGMSTTSTLGLTLLSFLLFYLIERAFDGLVGVVSPWVRVPSCSGGRLFHPNGDRRLPA